MVENRTIRSYAGYRGWHGHFAAIRVAISDACSANVSVMRKQQEDRQENIHSSGTPTDLPLSKYRAELQAQSTAFSTNPARTGFKCM